MHCLDRSTVGVETTTARRDLKTELEHVIALVRWLTMQCVTIYHDQAAGLLAQPRSSSVQTIKVVPRIKFPAWVAPRAFPFATLFEKHHNTRAVCRMFDHEHDMSALRLSALRMFAFL